VHVEFGNFQALEDAIDEQTCAILCEPLQGEGGVRPLSQEYLSFIKEMCDQHGLLLIFDEIQTGIGRTGSLFAYQQLGITPDILTMAKALGNGLPIGALLTTTDISTAFVPGTHASTFGGNPVACAAAVTTLKIMLADGFFDRVVETGDYFQRKLLELQQKFPSLLQSVRGRGLIVGAVLTERGVEIGPQIVNRMFERGVLMNFAGNVVLRFLPPLIVTRQEIDTLLSRLTEVLTEFSS